MEVALPLSCVTSFKEEGHYIVRLHCNFAEVDRSRIQRGQLGGVGPHIVPEQPEFACIIPCPVTGEDECRPLEPFVHRSTESVEQGLEVALGEFVAKFRDALVKNFVDAQVILVALVVLWGCSQDSERVDERVGQVEANMSGDAEYCTEKGRNLSGVPVSEQQ